MKKINIPFKDIEDIPEAHFHALRVCNSAESWLYKQSFYKLKSDILKRFGNEADYDLQIIKKACNSCNGKGVFKCEWKPDEPCWSCLGDGVYQTKKVVLKRYVLNYALFHEPIGELFGDKLKVFNGLEDDYYPTFKYEPFNGRIINEISGIVKHEQMPLNATWAYLYLLSNYNKTAFYKLIESEIKCYQTRTQHRLKTLLNKHTPLKAFMEFFKVKKEHFEYTDTLPF